MAWLNEFYAALQRNRIWQLMAATYNRFDEIDGELRAAAFGYYAFFSIFPLVVLFVTVASLFIDQQQATRFVLDYAGEQIPLSEDNQNQIIKLLEGIVSSRQQASVMAVLVLLWGAMRFFYVLVRGINCAWQTSAHNWWRLPLKNLMMLGILASAVLLGTIAPVIIEILRDLVSSDFEPISWLFEATVFLVPLMVLFYAFVMLYKLAPRCYARYREVWLAALLVTLLLRAAQYLFVLYVSKFSDFNALYGTLGSIMATLMWIYISGYVVIMGGCFCAVGAEVSRRDHALQAYPENGPPP